jgi:hypothetical protein
MLFSPTLLFPSFYLFFRFYKYNFVYFLTAPAVYLVSYGPDDRIIEVPSPTKAQIFSSPAGSVVK